MKDAFGVERVTKGLPSALRAGPTFPHQPWGGYAHMRFLASAKGKQVARKPQGLLDSPRELDAAVNQIKTGKHYRDKSRRLLDGKRY